MTKYKIRYEFESVRIMIVEANSEEEAREKFEEFDCLEDYEDYGVNMRISDVEKAK